MRNFGKNKVTSGEMSSTTVLLMILLGLLFPWQMNSYTPTENLAVNCGESGNNKFQSRNWFGDDVGTRTALLFSITGGQQSNIEPKSLNSPSVEIPYKSARLSHSQFTYSFSVSNGPKFLRLHFYSTSYGPNLEPHDSLFSVVASNFTLLQDFNASLWAPNDDDRRVTREFIINVETGVSTLNVTFLPSTNHSDAYYYAFVNGIEVVSMPSFLYYTNPNSDADDSAPLLVRAGYYHESYPPINNDTALGMFYRVNAGDSPVPPSKDGMFRNWESDNPYLEKEYDSSISTFFSQKPLNYKNNTMNPVPDYFAPEDVYKRARNYGKDGTANYNLTWEFEVDSEFNYLVRLHFCEFDVHVNHSGDRMFQIFISDTLVEEQADVLYWSGEKLVPIHRDYVVSMQNQQGTTGITTTSSKKICLSIKLQRLPEGQTNYRQVLMNGIEIFKLSDQGDKNLAGPNPAVALPNHQPPNYLPSKSRSTTVVIVAVAVAVSCVVLAASVVTAFLFFRRGGDHVDQHYSLSEGSSLPSHLCRYFTIAEILAATNNFDDVFVVGVGGFGHVYKGYIDNGTTPVAIKRLKAGSQQGFNEFLNEIKLLSKLRHLHLVSLIGYCNDGAEMILVYDFMQRGTLREYLYGSDNPPLSWKQRLQILLGAARGLHYLHEGASHNIIHRDVKTTNILLDEKWVAKVSDFGMSKVGPTGTSTTHVSTVVKGSFGYLDPEYYKRQRLTLKSDVYSFGVVLLEVLCARPPLVRTVDKQEASLVDWVRRCNNAGKIDQTVDPFLKNSISSECLKCYSRLAFNCLLDDGNQRPSMNDVVGVLEFTLQLAESSDEERHMFDGSQKQGNTAEKPLLLLSLPHFMSDEDGSQVRFTSSSDGSGSNSNTSKASSSVSIPAGEPLNSTGVFSEIANPRAR